MANLFWRFSSGIIFAKLSLPKKLKYTSRFSLFAVRNKNQMTFQGEKYRAGMESLTFRIGKAFSSSSICDSAFHLIYFQTKTDSTGHENFIFTECDFEINRQLGRSRDIDFSPPLLGLP